MGAAAINVDTINQLTGGRLGTHDVPCPLCGPYKRAPKNQQRRVMRIYRIETGFAGYHCARCGEKGAALDRNGPRPDPSKLERAHAEAAERDRAHKAERLNKTRRLWSIRMPAAGTVAVGRNYRGWYIVMSLDSNGGNP